MRTRDDRDDDSVGLEPTLGRAATWMGDGRDVPVYLPRFLLNAPQIQVNTQPQAFWNWDLYHEYGHYLLDKVAGATVFLEPDHTFSQTFPDKPLVPWLEGFADGFAAIAIGEPRPTRDCASEGVGLSSAPATPAPSPADEAPYNETAIAGVLWHLANYLGQNAPLQGFPILSAIHLFPPHSAREFRDALINYPATGNAADHDAISQIFTDTELALGGLSALQ